MNTLNTQRVQLPDGTCVKIEGGDAAETARLVANYLGLPGTVPRDGFVRNIPPENHDQPVLMPPVMNFRNPEAQPTQIVESRSGEQAALLPPTMNFTKPAKAKQQAGRHNYGGNFSGQGSPTGLTRMGDQAPLLPPRMNFPRK